MEPTSPVSPALAGGFFTALQLGPGDTDSYVICLYWWKVLLPSHWVGKTGSEWVIIHMPRLIFSLLIFLYFLEQISLYIMYAWGINFRDFNFFFLIYLFCCRAGSCSSSCRLGKSETPRWSTGRFFTTFYSVSPNTLFDTSCCGENIIVI